MYGALIKVGGSCHFFEGNSPGDIILRLEDVQDLQCLLRMGRRVENADGQKELDKLEAFLELYLEDRLTMEDIRALEVHLKVGVLQCVGIAENQDEIDGLKARV